MRSGGVDSIPMVEAITGEGRTGGPAPTRRRTDMDKFLAQKQRCRDEYMKSVAMSPDCPVVPAEQSTEADRWWPGTRPSTWEKMTREDIARARKKVA